MLICGHVERQRKATKMHEHWRREEKIGDIRKDTFDLVWLFRRTETKEKWNYEYLSCQTQITFEMF